MGLNKPIITTETDISGITTVLAEIKSLANTAAEKSTSAADDASTAATFAEAAATDAATAATKATSANTNAANVANRLTSTRAGYLDNLSGGVGGVKSVQRGIAAGQTKATGIEQVQVGNSLNYTHAAYLDITISSVNTSKSFVIAEHFKGSSNYNYKPIAKLVSATKIRVYVNDCTSSSSPSASLLESGLSWQVVEMK